MIPELVPLWDLSNAPMLGNGSLVSGLLTAFLGWNPEAHLLEFVAWAVYILWVGYAFLRPQPPAGGGARPAEAREG
jgi:hypothetical protein